MSFIRFRIADIHHRQNVLSQLLLDTALLLNDANADFPALKAHLKHMAQLAFDIARAREDQYVSHISNNSNNRGRLLMAQAYHHLAWGLTQLAAYVQPELPAQFRYCSNAVIVELVSFIATIFQPTALHLHDTAQLSRENVELWIARDQWKP